MLFGVGGSTGRQFPGARGSRGAFANPLRFESCPPLFRLVAKQIVSRVVADRVNAKVQRAAEDQQADESKQPCRNGVGAVFRNAATELAEQFAREPSAELGD
ncbi:hypothetical protein BWQ93_05995 [Sphingopyxis sp. QXT-31]|nr:hypothetical protein BWQ93_05995 [Sphingopyxis sp. QXT-31]